MSTYVLIHGAWHGSWCWDEVAPLIAAEEHVVCAPDLPGHGRNADLVKSATLDAYVSYVCGILDSLGDPVILVGHSMGGRVVTQVAEFRPEKVRLLVYVAGILLRNGGSKLNDANSLLNRNLVPHGRKMQTVKPDATRRVFYGDCPEETAARAGSLLVPQAVEPMQAAMRTTEGSFGSVPLSTVSVFRITRFLLLHRGPCIAGYRVSRLLL